MYGYQVAKLLEDHSQETPMMKQGALISCFALARKVAACWKAKSSRPFPVRRGAITHITETGRQTLQTLGTDLGANQKFCR